MKEMLLFSGGLDSFIAWHYVGKPQCLFVDVGQKYAMKEIAAIDNLKAVNPDLIVRTQRIPLGEWEKPDAEIPSRNMFLIGMAAMYGADQIWLIVQKGETSIPDRTQAFFRQFGQLLTHLHGKVIIIDTPFWEMHKSQMVAWYLEHGLPARDLLLTVGCYSSASGHCGNCGACYRRYVALKINGVDPGYKLTPEIKEFYASRISSYDEVRQAEIQLVQEGL